MNRREYLSPIGVSANRNSAENSWVILPPAECSLVPLKDLSPNGPARGCSTSGLRDADDNDELPKVPTREGDSDLVQARQAYSQRAWQTAFELFSRADSKQPLPAHELDQLARCAALIGNDETFLELLERCYQLHMAGGATLEAARSAFLDWFPIDGAGRFG